MNVSDWYLYQGVGTVVFQRVIGPRLMGLTPDEAEITAAMPRRSPCSTSWRGFSANNATLLETRFHSRT